MGTKGISCWNNNPQTTLYNPLLNLISVDSIVASENIHLYNPREAIDSNTLYPSCLMISELGNQNRIYLQRITHRIGNGCLLMETKENDSIVYGVLANDINNLLVVTAKGYTKCINIGKIKPCKSGKKGSKFIYMSDDDKIVACCCISPLKTIQINQEKINSFIVQTNESQELLSNIFNEDKSEESTTIIETNDSIVKEILSLLLTKEIWTKEELQQICAKRGIMLGSILEEINDYSYATLDDAVVEDKGTFINVEISYKDLLL
jgi:DNA gyrase/topoisomerase IV subunit A